MLKTKYIENQLWSKNLLAGDGIADGVNDGGGDVDADDDGVDVDGDVDSVDEGGDDVDGDGVDHPTFVAGFVLAWWWLHHPLPPVPLRHLCNNLRFPISSFCILYLY